MATKNTETIHELTTEEISRQVKIHSDRRAQIVEERAAICRNMSRTGADPVIDEDERAAREHARTLLNGAAPQSLSVPPEIAYDRILLREQRALDLVLKILSNKNLALRAAEAVAWAEEHADEWRTLCRETVLTAI